MENELIKSINEKPGAIIIGLTGSMILAFIIVEYFI